ncbi:short-chain dehydrogenase/reductase family 16C member 6-like [Nylanderia fulva]|uniref:short-chain dehydrogenase/reductase family 16C member 6-like n=1 Tax=Nylanderia fulva TaxID=613905 RepID=UPI0010FADA05|nr:short-chain dehydrogenase/reductase family 16C member 6-like [Nylanderia fulva]XP_029166763.1 short-chain dehydrogenase/reductase family 16C member 6-like [Nylanderia fulva]
MVKAYNGALVLADVLLLILKILYYICESVYRFFIPAEEKSVVGEIVLITGTGHGIGRELALRYASLGATVVCWDLNEVSNQETLNQIKKAGGATAAYAYQCDVSKREEVLSVAERVKKEVGDVTILVNNAGIMPCHAFLDHTSDEISRIFNINVLAHFWMLQAFLPSMIEKNYGHVVALSSLAGIGGLPNLVPYCASKFAVRGLMESISEELRISSKGKSLIKFTTIYPYMVDTGLCKNPKIRFPNAMPLVSPGKAASEIILAQRRGYRERSVPAIWLTLSVMLRNFPDHALYSMIDFFDSGVEADS